MSVDGVFGAGGVAAVGAARDVAAVNGARDGEGIGVSDRVGAKRLYAIGLAAFLASSAACGLAPTLGFLIASRAVQGSAAAVMLPASLALVRQAYGSPVRRAKAIAVWAVGGTVAMAGGPGARGALTSGLCSPGPFFLH